jgi:hypothetical protein
MTFWFYILAQKDSNLFRKFEPYLTFLNIHQLERGCQHTNQGGGIGRIKSVTETA